MRPHGTTSRYRSGCRCEACRQANTEYYQQKRARLRAEAADGSETWHGTRQGYQERGCRCDGCRRWESDYRAALLAEDPDRWRASQRASTRRYYQSNRDRISAENAAKWAGGSGAYGDRETNRNYRREAGYQERQNQSLRARAALTAAGAHRNGEPWTATEDEILRDPLLSRTEKALALGRSLWSVHHRLHRLSTLRRREDVAA